MGEGRGSETASLLPEDDGRVEVAGEPASAPNIPAANFAITDDVGLGKGGEVQKFNDNLAAIRALKQIEADGRRATPEEQALLARYVGWGGLANAFPDPSTGEFKGKWSERGPELRELLTDAEYKAARRSTRNAHYTSQTVVSAMWNAVKRLGFKGGLVLESSMGTGNFLGLAPKDSGAKFVGVEYDSLTSRIASALYPQATVLHSGFQKVPTPDNTFALNIGNPPFGNESLRFQFKPELNGVSIHNQFFRAGMDSLRPGGIQAMVVSRFLMDAQDKSTRLALAKQARLVGLIRLPDTAFKENARTEVVTDIVILQKLTPAEQDEMAAAFAAYNSKPEKDRKAETERQFLANKVPDWVNT
ncbi:MAG: class I SAM-dependent methyltransferase, partial [Burkholderiales bacterium]